VAPLREVARTGDPGAAEAEYHADGALAFVLSAIRGCGIHQRIFRVASPTRTSTKEMIQKRTITFGSAQPLSS